MKWRHVGFKNIKLLIKLCFYRERVRRNPKVDRIGSLFLAYILNYIKNEYCEWQDALDMLNNRPPRWCILSKINQLTVGKTVLVLFRGFSVFVYGILAVCGCHCSIEYSRLSSNNYWAPYRGMLGAYKKYRTWLGGGWAADWTSINEKIRETIGRSPSFRVSSSWYEFNFATIPYFHFALPYFYFSSLHIHTSFWLFVYT